MAQVEDSTAKPNRSDLFSAKRAIKDANEITACINELQILNIKHDVGVERIHEILPMFIKATSDLLANARQLMRGE